MNSLTPYIATPKQLRGNTVLLLLLIALVTGSALRLSLLALYPVVVLLIILQFRLKLMQHSIVLLLLAVTSAALALLNGFFWQYHLLSLYYMIPFLVLLFAVPSQKTFLEQGILEKFMAILSMIALINDIVGFAQFIRHPSDDSFTGLFSQYGISLYALVILNTIVFAYYFSLYLGIKKRADLLKSLFFLLSAIMGFYGSGLMVFLAAFALSFLTFRFIATIKIIISSTVLLIAAYYLVSFLRPEALYYYEVSIKRLLLYDKSESPRKIIAHYNYIHAYPHNIKDLLLGSGPGTFNSRSAFMAGSPYQFNAIPFLKSSRQPYYFKNYAYPLWNHTNTSQALYQDGFRNQPFSSVLAFLGEYGLVFSFLFVWSVIAYYRRVRKLCTTPEQKNAKWLFKFLMIFLLLLLCVDNYYEYPEIMLLILFVMKLTHIKIAGKISPAIPQMPSAS
jgi:hypothetical protein